VAQVRYRANCPTLSVTVLFAQPLVFSVIINLGGCGPKGYLVHMYFVAAFEPDFKDNVSLLPLVTCGIS
jgi:hypothetical protein